MSCTKYRAKRRGVVAIFMTSQRQSSKRRGHPMPKYSLDELYDWCNKQYIFHELYCNWVFSGFSKMLKPSIDRIDNSKPYSLDNIQLMTWEENKKRGHLDLRKGKIKHGNNPQKPVIGKLLPNGELKEYPSSNQASRETGCPQPSISSCCRGVISKTKNKNGSSYKFWFKII